VGAVALVWVVIVGRRWCAGSTRWQGAPPNPCGTTLGRSAPPIVSRFWDGICVFAHALPQLVAVQSRDQHQICPAVL